MISQQILRNTQGTLLIDRPPGPATGSVAVTITRADGTTLMSGTATLVGSTYQFTLPPQAELDRLAVTWSGTWDGVVQSITTQAEIVGGYLFRVDTARAYGDRVLADTTRYPDSDIEAARVEITDMFNQICSVSFIPRYGRDILDGSNTDTIDLTNRRPRRVIGGSMSGTALTAQQLADIALYPGGRAIFISGTSWPWKRQSVTLAYEHGWPVVPADIALAALVLVRYQLVSNDISDRMVAFDNDLGTVRLSVPGRQFPTGIPIVDSTLARYDECPLLIA
jgi:hypothetical protein